MRHAAVSHQASSINIDSYLFKINQSMSKLLTMWNQQLTIHKLIQNSKDHQYKIVNSIHISSAYQFKIISAYSTVQYIYTNVKSKKITIPDCKGKTFPSCFLWKCLHVFPLPCSCGWLWRRRRDSSPLPSTLGSHSSRIWTTCLEGTAQSEEPATLNMKKKIKNFEI